jgi:hypothetical protein
MLMTLADRVARRGFGMAVWLAEAQAWVMGLGAQYGVNPIIFGAIYVGAIPFFLLFTGLAIKRLRAGKPAVLPILAAGFCFVSAYLYLAVVGRNIPIWVWLFIGALVGYGAWSAVRDFRKKLIE